MGKTIHKRGLKKEESTVELDSGMFQEILDLIPDLIYIKDRKGRFRLLNQSVVKHFRAGSKADIIGKTDFDFHPLERARWYYNLEQKVIHDGERMVAHDEKVYLESDHPEWWSATKVPLKDSQGRVIGLLGIGRDVTARKNAEILMKKKARDLAHRVSRVEAELNLARDFQRAVLPRTMPKISGGPEHPGESIAVQFKYVPNSQVGGDFFDVGKLSDTTAGLFLCDAIGHGVRAALLAALIKGLLEQLHHKASDPAAFMTDINQALHDTVKNQDDSVFVTALYMIVDLADHSIHCACAGHLDPLIYTSATGLWHPFHQSQSGPALGLYPRPRFGMDTYRFEPGDRVLLLTDGILEVENSAGELLGQDRFLALLQDCSGFSCEKTLDAVLEGAYAFAAKDSFIDDICMVTMEMKAA